MRVLVVDDEPDILRVMSRALVAQGIQVETASDGATALRRLQEQQYDVMLLDVLLPGGSGVELLPTVLAQQPDLRVLMISAVNEPRTRLRCFELGAVDYLAKPFVLAELVARVRVHARAEPSGDPRSERRRGERRVAGRRATDAPPVDSTAGQSDARFVFAADGTLDLLSRAYVTGAGSVALSQRESLVLAHLMRRAGDVCTREEILQEVWGSDGASAGNVVDVYVGRLRTKLPSDTITTIRNAGYAYAAT